MSVVQVFACIVMMLIMAPSLSAASSLALSTGTPTDTYTYPWFCLVKLRNQIVSACTIIQKAWVVTSVDSLNEKIPWNNKRHFYQNVNNLEVTAGTERLREKNDPKKYDYYQEKIVKRLCVGHISNWDNPTVVSFEENPRTLEQFEKDSYGLALGLGLLEIHSTFTWSPHVQPAPLFTPETLENQMEGIVGKFVENTEISLLDQKPCVMVRWSKSADSLLESNVIFVTDQACKESYCAYDMGNCLKFPKLRYLSCFKTLTFVDMCPIDRGGAVYCADFDSRVLGILTTAVNCGGMNLPSVFTSIEFVHRLYTVVTKKAMEPIPHRNDFTTLHP